METDVDKRKAEIVAFKKCLQVALALFLNVGMKNVKFVASGRGTVIRNGFKTRPKNGDIFFIGRKDGGNIVFSGIYYDFLLCLRIFDQSDLEFAKFPRSLFLKIFVENAGETLPQMPRGTIAFAGVVTHVSAFFKLGKNVKKDRRVSVEKLCLHNKHVARIERVRAKKMPRRIEKLGVFFPDDLHQQVNVLDVELRGFFIMVVNGFRP